MTFTPFSLPTDPNSQILLNSTLSTQVQGASIPVAVVDVQNRPGWYYNSTLQTDSFVWTIFNGTGQNYTLGDVQNLTFTATHDNLPTNKCYIAVSSATSKIVYENNNDDLIPGEKCLFYSNTQPQNPEQLKLVKLNLVTNIGPCLPGEALTSITLEGTNAILFPDSLQICVENIGYLFDGETVPVVVKLSTYDPNIATLNATLQITNGDLTALNTTLGINTTSVDANTTSLDANTAALDINTTALDNNTTASDNNTAALDINTTASDNNTTSVDANTASVDANKTASDNNTTALGTLNTTLQGGINTKYPAVNYDAFGRFRVSEPYTLFDSSYRYADNGLWASSSTGGATYSFTDNQGLMSLTVIGTTGSQVVRETFKVFSYQPGKSLLVMNSFAGTTVAGVQQRIGYFGAQNGIYFQINGDGTCSFVKRSYNTGAVVNTSVLQSAWNGDKLNGTGSSGYTLDLTKSQLLWLDFEWLGVGTVRCGFVIDGQFILCHSFNWANDPASSPSTYMTTASLPCRCEIINNGGAGGTLKQICSTVISEGGVELRGTQQAISSLITGTGIQIGTSIAPAITIRLKSNRLDAICILTAASLLGVDNVRYNWQIIVGYTLNIAEGAWISAGTDSSIQYYIAGTYTTPLPTTGVRILTSGLFAGGANRPGSYSVLREALTQFQLERNGLTGTPIQISLACVSSAANSDLYATVDWEEVSR
jgi:hypothetical protein